MKNTGYRLLLCGAILILSSFSTTTNSTILRNEKPPVKSVPITFIENAFPAALKKAKAERKFIFVDAYAVWCGPCKQLKNTTFKDSQTADFFNKNFINLSIDMEKGQGISLAEQWEVNEYPTLLVLDYNGKVVVRSTGFLDAKQLSALGKRALQKK